MKALIDSPKSSSTGYVTRAVGCRLGSELRKRNGITLGCELGFVDGFRLGVEDGSNEGKLDGCKLGS